MKYIFLFFVFTLGACAGLVVPVLHNRELLIHESGQLYYPYCADYGFFSKKCKEQKADFYDLSKPEVRAELKDFSCKHKSRQF